MAHAARRRLVRFGLAFTLLGLLIAARPGALIGHTDQPGFQDFAAATATWPVSTGLLLSEVMTGGASASDEFVEIYNASGTAVDLAGLELVYVTASGSTVSRKQTWTVLVLPANAHLLLANSSGVFAASADGIYTGGFSATGGSVALRTLDGAVIDSLSWGDASSIFVEGTAGAAPPAGSSLERLPGGSAGNATDTNSNALDVFVQPSPVPQSLLSPPVPAPTPTPLPTIEPTPEPTSMPTITPEPTATATLTPTITPMPTDEATAPPTDVPAPSPTAVPSPTLAPTPSPTPTPTPSPTPTPTPSATPAPTPTPTPSPTPTPTPSPTPTPTLDPISIAEARTRAIGSTVKVAGIVTAAAAVILDGSTIAVDDGSAAIFVRIPDSSPVLEPGRRVLATGVLAAPYGNLELRVADGGLQVLNMEQAPQPAAVQMSAVGEATEARLVKVSVTVTGINSGSGSLTLVVTDASADGRVFFHAPLGAVRDDYSVGDRVTVTGVVGDRLGLYRIWPRVVSDVVLDQPAPTPDATANANTAAYAHATAHADSAADRHSSSDAFAAANGNPAPDAVAATDRDTQAERLERSHCRPGNRHLRGSAAPRCHGLR